jgi:hypothetical protein
MRLIAAMDADGLKVSDEAVAELAPPSMLRSDLVGAGQGEPLFIHGLVVFPTARNAGWLTITGERITLYCGRCNLKP